jgi:hypothetical protein
VRGPLTLRRLQAGLAQLARYLRDSPRQRPNQLARIRQWLIQFNRLPAPAAQFALQRP